MNPLKHYLARRRLEKSMKPCPEYRVKRLAQFSPERRKRYFENVGGIGA